jgi:hypothetical protein
MNTRVLFNKYHIATCGINCGTCMAFQREKNKCIGCMSPSGNKANHCINCRIKNCEFLKQADSKFCFDCEKFPCLRMKNMDKRYRIRYKTSLIQNLRSIKEAGIKAYLHKESERWTCPDCGSMVCVHRPVCKGCGRENTDPEFKKLFSQVQ